MTSKKMNLQTLLDELKSIQENHDAKKAQFRHRLDRLETERREYFEQFTRNSRDPEIRTRLERAEAEVQDAHEAMARSESEMKAAARDTRQRIIDLINQERSEREDRLRQLRRRRQQIRGVYMPRALARVTALEEEQQQIDHETEEINRRIQELGRLDMLDSPQVASQLPGVG